MINTKIELSQSDLGISRGKYLTPIGKLIWTGFSKNRHHPSPSPVIPTYALTHLRVMAESSKASLPHCQYVPPFLPTAFNRIVEIVVE